MKYLILFLLLTNLTFAKTILKDVTGHTVKVDSTVGTNNRVSICFDFYEED